LYWQVASSATIGSGNNFVGKILALGDITLNGRIFRGKALTTNGAIAIAHHQRVNGPACNGTLD
jgi:type VI secretion system secreted protein VgrG